MKFVFDVDDTLYDMTKPFFETVHAFFPELDVDIQKLYIRTRYYSDLKFEDSMTGVITPKDLQIYRIQEALKEFDYLITDEKAYAFQKQYEENQFKIKPFPELEKLFDELKQKDLLGGIITNGLQVTQRNKIENLNLKRWFDEKHMLVSEEIGCNKPDQCIFETFIKETGYQHEQLVYVGDTFSHDIVGAANAGWIPIWFNHRNRVNPDTKNYSYYEANTLKSLITLIHSLIEKHL